MLTQKHVIIMVDYFLNNQQQKQKGEVFGMHYIMTIIWAVLISLATSFVLTSMAGEPFVLFEALILAGILSIVAIFLGEVALKTEKE